MDANVEPKRDVEMWSETRWNGCWNDDDGVGLYLHMGRMRKNLDIWWAQMVAYLPGNELVVDRCWGRNPNEFGLTVGALDVTATPDGWTSTFDGVGQRTDYYQLTRGPRGAAYPCSTLSWSVSAAAVSPIFNPYDEDGGTIDFAGDAHVQQGFSTTGWLEVDGERYALDGIGFSDHSSGTRDWAKWTSHRFMLAVLDGATVHAVTIDGTDGDPSRRAAFGAVFRGGERLGVKRLEMPLLTDRWRLPQTVHAEVELDNGERLPIASVELVHVLPMTVSKDNDNVNGIDWEGEGDPVVLMEGFGRLTFEDGTVGCAFIDSSARRSELKRPPGV